MALNNVVFLDTETTGLDPNRHEIWEIGYIVDGEEKQWFLEVDLGKADPRALEIGRYFERFPRLDDQFDPSGFAKMLVRDLRGHHIVGAVPSFDDAFLKRFLAKHKQPVTWHYHLIDVETLAVGYLWRKVAENREAGYDDSLKPSLPWDSEDLSLAVGVDPEDFDRHTALGDARWAKAIYEAVTFPFDEPAEVLV